MLTGAEVMGGRRKKTVAELRVENRWLRQTHWVMAASPVVRTIAVMAGWVWIVSEASDAVVALAGETTAADFGFRFLGNLQVSTAVAWTLAVFGVGYGSWERRVRKAKVEQMEMHLHELERGKDAGRTTSGLNSRGDSPRDREADASGPPDGA